MRTPARTKRVQVHSPGSPEALALESALDTLQRLGIPKRALWLGGGATLAARWLHREERSVALFMRWRNLPEDMRMDLPLRIEGTLPRERLPSMASGLSWARWDTGHGTAAVFTRSPAARPWLSEETEARHGLPLEKPLSVLWAKIQGRMMNCGQILLRDLHDLAACAVHEPNELTPLQETLGFTGVSDLGPEILFHERIRLKGPGEAGKAESLLFRTASLLFSEGIESFVRQAQALGTKWLERIPSHPREHPAPVRRHRIAPVALAPLEDFRRHPAFLETQPFRPCGLMSGVGKTMSGVPLSPTSREIRDWIRAKPEDPLPAGAAGYLGEALSRMDGMQMIRFRQGCGASLAEIARTAHRIGIQGAELPAWLNQHIWIAKGDRREETEGYESLGPFGRSPG